jgi:uncharacterized SAM-binding protein YcdF (DUF218 family)
MAVTEPDVFDVIVVLGAAQLPDGSPGPVIERRVAEAVRHWRAGRAPYVLFSGGKTMLPVPEAETMAQVARDAGVVEAAIMLEDQSTRTVENAAFTIKMIKARGWNEVLLVTDDFHMARAVYCYRALRMPVWKARVRNPMNKKVFLSWCREIIGRLIYPRQVRAYLGKW